MERKGGNTSRGKGGEMKEGHEREETCLKDKDSYSSSKEERGGNREEGRKGEEVKGQNQEFAL